MASRFVIGGINCEFWQGPPPRFPGERTDTFRRAGADGVGFQTLGASGETFEVRVTYWSSSYALAVAQIETFKALIGTQVVITYNAIDFNATYDLKYFVNMAEVESCQAVVRQIRSSPAPAINRTNAAELVMRLVLTPVDVSS